MSHSSESHDNPSVNRYLDDKAMDHIDHALGRPVWPLKESYRNNFATGKGGDLAKQFDASTHWEIVALHRDMAFFAVTASGRQALAAYLETLDVDKRHRAYVLTFEGQSRVVAAKSRSHARYSEWRTISDCFCELTFADFIKKSQVRLAS